jgi:hypothetical protein
VAMATRCVNPSFEMPNVPKENSAVEFSLRIGATGSWAVRSRLRRGPSVLFGLKGEIKAAVQAKWVHAVHAATF